MDYIEIIGKLIGAVLAGIALYIAPRLKRWLNAKISATQREQLTALIKALVYGAQQMYWNKDGKERKDYVVDNLKKLGIKVSEDVNAIIEAEVKELKMSEGEL